MNIRELNTVYFIGIGGIGMSALARYFRMKGLEVCGYDRTPTSLTDALISEGISIHFDDDIDKIPANVLHTNGSVLVVYTPAIPQDHKEYRYLRSLGHRLYKRSEVLGIIAKNEFTIAVAGTHGKTTTSSMIAHLLKASNLPINAFLGGIASNYNTNSLLAEEARATVVEADEFDRSFLTLCPDIAVLTSVDADHLDIYGDHAEMQKTFQRFLKQVKPQGCIIYHKKLPALYGDHPHVCTYGIAEGAAIEGNNVRVENGAYHFDCTVGDVVMQDLVVGLPGWHNIENSLAAVAVALQLGLSEKEIRVGLAGFKGVKRRFEYQLRSERLVYIDDYAHHPEELKATISSVRQMYPEKKVTGIFQPHLFTRTRDFADAFARSLELLDELILLEIYPARELPIEGINAQMLLNKVQLQEKALLSQQELIQALKERKIEVLLTLGAGDIDRLVAPIKEALQSSKKQNQTHE